MAFIEKMQKYFTGKKLPESVYFYTFHKCASSLFSTYILKNIEGLRHIDYAHELYAGTRGEGTLKFMDKGCAYGPIRLSANPDSSAYKCLVAPTVKDDFLRNRTAVFLVRDPRDILVSAYYSFGFSHSLSDVRDIKVLQEQIRMKIQSQSLEHYVLEAAHIQNKNFHSLSKLAQSCERSVILKYEDLVENFEFFVSQLRTHIEINDNVACEIYKRSRPKLDEDRKSHRRSGKVGGFRNSLESATIVALNNKLVDTLTKFGYTV